MKRQKSKKRWKINRYVIVRNEQVEGSIPSISSIRNNIRDAVFIRRLLHI